MILDPPSPSVQDLVLKEIPKTFLTNIRRWPWWRTLPSKMFSSRRPLVQSSKECGRPSLSGWTYPWKKYNPMTNNDNTMTTITNNGKQWQRNENKMTTQWQNNDNAMPNNVRDKSLSLRQDLADAIPVLKQESHYAIYEAYSVVQVCRLYLISAGMI